MEQTLHGLGFGLNSKILCALVLKAWKCTWIFWLFLWQQRRKVRSFWSITIFNNGQKRWLINLLNHFLSIHESMSSYEVTKLTKIHNPKTTKRSQGQLKICSFTTLCKSNVSLWFLVLPVRMLFPVSTAQKTGINTGFKCEKTAVDKTKSLWQLYNYIVQER